MELMAWAAFGLGLGSGLHCTLMCSPLMLSFSGKSLYAQILYQSGRITSYALLGLLMAFVGKAFWFIGIQNHLSLLAGLLIVAIVLLPERFFLAGVVSAFWLRLKTKALTGLKASGLLNRFFLGMLNGFLPCPMVYIALAGALAAETWQQAAVWMILFGLGTLPLIWILIFGLGKLSSFKKFSPAMRKLSPAFALLVGIMLILRGSNVEIPYLAHKLKAPQAATAATPVVCE
jgi:uncharacterized protein